jgi:hypothetical protein
MQSSSTTRLYQNMNEYEENSDKKVPFTSYFILVIMINDLPSSLKVLKYLLKNKILKESPLSVYMYKDRNFKENGSSSQNNYFYYLLYSSLDAASHYENGSHQKICSIISSKLARKYDRDVECTIVEIDTRSKVCVYFQYKVYNNILTSLKNLSNGKLVDSNMTLKEMIEIVEKKYKLKWDDVPNEDKYGVFYKLGEKEHTYEKLSEIIDLRELNKYLSFFFE